ncbi:DNA repair protein REV1 isoform X2 [Tripterygium wilfordii]|uniref:DNA repair protein REV1 isoform X2 n=1 Tax=Tripterygium wilfordii TaxID=458696 RepID=A0A7J7DXR7_TRIWF|nr:DNA repair protein REV1 isoform X2 [Tripterygium wilfordii]
MAWGANSLSNFGSYMVKKNWKLHNPFEAEASTSLHGGSSSEKPIFHEVSIFVDGFTVPSGQV